MPLPESETAFAVIGVKWNDRPLPSFPRRNVTPYPDTGRESIFGCCHNPNVYNDTTSLPSMQYALFTLRSLL